MAAEKGEIPNTLTFSIPMGGQSGTLMFFWNQLLTGQHLANSGEAQLKKTPCISYIQIYITSYITYNTKVIPPYLLHPPPHPHLDWGDETLSAADNSRFHKFVVVYRFVSFILDNFAFWQFFADKFAIFYQFLCKGWGLSAKLGKHSAIWGKLGTALQAYALNPCTKFPPNPTSR